MISDFFAPSIDFMRFGRQDGRTNRIERPHVESIGMRVGFSAFALATLVVTTAALGTSPTVRASTLRTADHARNRTDEREAALTSRIAAVADAARKQFTDGDEPPSEGVLRQTYVFAQQVADEVAARQLVWSEPNVAANPLGQVVLEWWNGERKLTLYFDGETVEYVRSSGPDIDADMKDGTVRSSGHWVSLWQWLNSKRAWEVAQRLREQSQTGSSSFDAS